MKFVLSSVLLFVSLVGSALANGPAPHVAPHPQSIIRPPAIVPPTPGAGQQPGVVRRPNDGISPPAIVPALKH